MELVDAKSVKRHFVAELLHSSESEVKGVFEQELRKMGGSALGDPQPAPLVLDSASSIISDVIKGLRDSEVPTNVGSLAISREIGVTRARHGVHPTESLRAAEVLFEVILSWIADRLGNGEGTQEVFLEVCLLLNKSIAMRIREASGWYASFLLQEIHRSQFDERSRIARELHDRVSYGVTVAHRRLETYQRFQKHDPEGAKRCVPIAQVALEEAMESIRKLISDLRLSEAVASLEKAINGFLEETGTTGANTSLLVNGDEGWVDSDVRDEVFLIVREALRNALSHGAANEILVRIDIAPHELRATIDDDGVGFVMSKARDGAGLSIMEERAALLGGEVLVSSRSGKGTRVELMIPLLRNADAGSQ